MKHCCHYDHLHLTEQDAYDNNITFPEAYTEHHMISAYALARKEKSRSVFCTLPGDHLLEAEAMGAEIIYDDPVMAVRSSGPVFDFPFDTYRLSKIDLQHGRVRETLCSCNDLTNAGENVLLETTGPMTILDALTDITKVFRFLKKDPSSIIQIFNAVGTHTLEFIKAAQEHGVRFFSFADPLCSASILGPHTCKAFINMFTADFLKEISKNLHDDSMLLICPEIISSLTEAGKIQIIRHTVPVPDRYDRLCIDMASKVTICGQICVKKAAETHDINCFNEIVFK